MENKNKLPIIIAALVVVAILVIIVLVCSSKSHKIKNLEKFTAKVEQEYQNYSQSELDKAQASFEKYVAKVEKKEVPQRTPRAKKVQDTQKTLTPQAADVCNDLAAVQEQEESTPLPSGEGQKGEAVVTLTEHDIPITRPENYKYTPEELALMRKQANEAYLKWVQLELEISKYNLEQTAQK